ncbi:diguanylate cyclase (GGDEF)-like protein/PAS domain S-box-containing protein [Clostridium tetanomorphum]|uniref:putative bifunctional diguanylate cyclase/phosphodiesterase n=1 Tax=Clostridium tetanomorphum TaxID=1553 RepID=UPI000448B0F8|nr:bifunctional diguanylate cyclase/phosphodiesterase [Clostridium tetanomorphum]KAJ51167.1 PAS domain S-box/diguanylate cyclase (GGDEF) domain-containing protein [Clostridium tetanomorphum DSM 665]MBP1866175.1 diguanylate cyclase (GGDEF)-like protein/PAS domain S-box-containing protein [Clostridium tetanomorphum]NRS85154.1 diguanylate cyclase (GGDEF)-like protein/PAS domain S-box-containing protein [Clostridium tetanomorphum]
MKKERFKIKNTRYISLQIILIIIMLILFESIFYKYKVNMAEHNIDIIGEDVSGKIQENININISPLISFGYNFSIDENITEKSFNKLSEYYMKNFPDILFLEHKNKDNITDMIYPKEGLGLVIGKSLQYVSEDLIYLNKEMKDKKIIISGPKDLNYLDYNIKAIIVKYPIFKDGKFNGLIVCAIDLEKFLNNNIKKEILRSYNISISNKGEFYGSEVHKGHICEKNIHVLDNNLKIQVSSKQNYIKNILDELVAATITLVLLILFIFYLEIEILNKNNKIDELTKLKDKLKEDEVKLQQSYEDLSAVYEELAATEEELRFKYEELQKSEEALRISEERYKLAVDGANDAIWEWNIEKGKLFISDRWENIVGYSLNENISMKKIIKTIIHPEDKKIAIEDFNKYIRGEVSLYKSTFRVKSSDGDYKWIFNRGKALWNNEGRAVRLSGSLTDITDRKKSDEKMLQMASYDQLTNLPNKRLFLNNLQNHMNKVLREDSDENIAVIFLDLDNFKKINDTLGHNYGDQLLKVVAGILEFCVGETSAVARVGGDEFLIYLYCDKDYNNVINLCEEIKSMLNNPLEIGRKHMYTSASMGISIFPQDSIDVNILLKNADTAMYRAKNFGKNNYCFFTKDMRDEVVRKTEIEKGLREALENNELQVYYQPQIDVNSRRLVGFEALLRWKSKELGWVSPAEFIPIAEETGLILPIGEWIIKTACNQHAEWMKKGYKPFIMAINLSTVQIQHKDFGKVVRKIIEESKVDTKYLEFEITETILMESLDCSMELLKEFRDLEIKVALDDFGTGYSSFNYLKSLPISTIKIDKSFIDNINFNSNDKDITHGIIKLAHRINMDVIAEGVEKEDQVWLLQDMKCDRIQGYYFSKPLALQDAENLLTKLS